MARAFEYHHENERSDRMLELKRTMADVIRGMQDPMVALYKMRGRECCYYTNLYDGMTETGQHLLGTREFIEESMRCTGMTWFDRGAEDPENLIGVWTR